MKVAILISDKRHPILPRLQQLQASMGADCQICHTVAELMPADLLFLVSCVEYVPAKIRQQYQHSLVIHASDLPDGKGMSPHIWQILEGKDQIVVSLIEAADKIDAGDIWHQVTIQFDGSELYDEINEKLFQAEIDLIQYALKNHVSIKPRKQAEKPVKMYPKRTPKDSELNIDQSIAENFNLLRVADPDRYPAFFYYQGQKYLISIRKEGEAHDSENH